MKVCNFAPAPDIQNLWTARAYRIAKSGGFHRSLASHAISWYVSPQTRPNTACQQLKTKRKRLHLSKGLIPWGGLTQHACYLSLVEIKQYAVIP